MEGSMGTSSTLGSEYRQGDLLYEGKAKRIFSVLEHPELLWQEFKDSFTAFNGVKKATMVGKGAINCQIAGMIYRDFSKHGIATHLVWNKIQRQQRSRKS